MGYIEDIRKKINHDNLITTSACVLIVNQDNEILLQERSDNKLYTLLGGSIEFEEKVIDCAKREAYEEAGLEDLNLIPFGVFTGKETTFHYPNKDITNYTVVAFYAKVKDVILKTNEESISLKFYSLGKLPKGIMDLDLKVINKFKNNDFEIVID